MLRCAGVMSENLGRTSDGEGGICHRLISKLGRVSAIKPPDLPLPPLTNTT